jgi:aspartate 1-decarboxylase
MYITVLKSKLHRVKVTSINIDYDGSCGIDKDWMDALDIKEYEQVHIYNISNGNRFVTYAFSEDAGSKKISLNGAAAHKADTEDLIIICTYMMVSKDDKFQEPKILKIEN